MRIGIRKKSNPHKESLERRIKANEEYLETMVAGTKEYQLLQEALETDYERLDKMNQPKFKASDILPWATLAATMIVGAVVPVYGMNKAYQKEEVDGELSNGKVWSMATKNIKH